MTEVSRLRLRRHALSALALAALTFASACSGAFVDRRREAGAGHLAYVGRSKPDAPSICYNAWTATPQQVAALAQDVCAARGETAVPVRQSTFDCRLFYPTRADYTCVPGGDALPPAP